jgi:small-conductance mechanosensitive channel
MEQGKNIISKMYNRVDKIKWKDVFSLDNAMDNIFNVVGAVLVLAMAHVVGSLVYRTMASIAKSQEAGRLSEKDLEKGAEKDGEKNKQLNGTRRSIILYMIGTFAYTLSVIIGFVIMLHMFGVEIATIVTALGTILLVVVFSLQGTFSDIVSGVLLALFQTYDLGDIIVLGDIEGIVVDFGVVNTLVEHLTTRALITIPNTTVQKSIVSNYSKHRHHIFALDIALSGGQRGYAELISSLKNDLDDEQKYPDIVRHPSVTNGVGITDLSESGTIMRISVPFLVSADLNSKRTRVRTQLMKTLDELKAVKRDNAYDYIVTDKFGYLDKTN